MESSEPGSQHESLEDYSRSGFQITFRGIFGLALFTISITFLILYLTAPLLTFQLEEGDVIHSETFNRSDLADSEGFGSQTWLPIVALVGMMVVGAAYAVFEMFGSRHTHRSLFRSITDLCSTYTSFLFTFTALRWLGFHIAWVSGPEGFGYRLHVVPYLNLIGGLLILTVSSILLAMSLKKYSWIEAKFVPAAALKLSWITTLITAGALLVMPLFPFASIELGFVEGEKLYIDSIILGAGEGSATTRFKVAAGMLWAGLHISLAASVFAVIDRSPANSSLIGKLVHVYLLQSITLVLGIIFTVLLYISLVDGEAMETGLDPSLSSNWIMPLAYVALAAAFAAYIFRSFLPVAQGSIAGVGPIPYSKSAVKWAAVIVVGLMVLGGVGTGAVVVVRYLTAEEPPLTSAERPTWDVGNHWLYQSSANTPDEEIIEYSVMTVTERVKDDDGNYGYLVYERIQWDEWFVVDDDEEYTSNLNMMRHDGEMRWLDFPLEDGKNWTWEDDDGDEWQAKVSGPERVTVPAGGFDTFKVEIFLEGDAIVEVYYSPKVNYLVKYTYLSDANDDVSYSLVTWGTKDTDEDKIGDNVEIFFGWALNQADSDNDGVVDSKDFNPGLDLKLKVQFGDYEANGGDTAINGDPDPYAEIYNMRNDEFDVTSTKSDSSSGDFAETIVLDMDDARQYFEFRITLYDDDSDEFIDDGQFGPDVIDIEPDSSYEQFYFNVYPVQAEISTWTGGDYAFDSTFTITGSSSPDGSLEMTIGLGP